MLLPRLTPWIIGCPGGPCLGAVDHQCRRSQDGSPRRAQPSRRIPTRRRSRHAPIRPHPSRPWRRPSASPDREDDRQGPDRTCRIPAGRTGSIERTRRTSAGSARIRFLPDVLEVGDPRLHVNEVDRTFAKDLICDMGSVQSLRVSGLRDVQGGLSSPFAFPRCKRGSAGPYLSSSKNVLPAGA